MESQSYEAHEFTVLNASLRRETLNGKEYLVAPVTLIQFGVLNGSNGPILYEEKDAKETADAWNGMPLLLNHPQKQGRPTSGRDPEIINRYGLGNVYRVTSNGKLAGEAWFDIEKANSVHPGIIEDIENGRKVEVSTGLGLSLEQREGVHNDRTYLSIARNYRPDHLAVIVDGRGACSVDDGCGVNNKSSEEPVEAPNTRNKEPDMATKTEDKERELIVNQLIDCQNCPYDEDDRDTLNEMDMAMLKKCKEMMGKMSKTENELEEERAIANMARQGFTSNGHHIFVGNEGKWEKKNQAVNTPQEIEEEEPVTNKKVTPKKEQPQTMEDWLSTAPPEVVAAFNNAKTFSDNRKTELIEQITNSRFNTFTPEELQTYDLEDVVANGCRIPGLQTIADRIQDQEDQQPVRAPSYIGAAVGNQETLRARRVSVPEPMPNPEDMWGQIYNEHGQTLNRV